MTPLYRTILLIAFYAYTGKIEAQSTDGYQAAFPGSNMTLLYDININTGKTGTGIEETYNGGVKTVMIKNDRVRIRLVSLMRIQSIYFFKRDSALSKVLITKESGEKKYKYSLTASDWKFYNAKYDSLTYTFLDDSISVAGYNCKKAIITLKDGKEVVAYYSTALKSLDKFVEPMFAGLPGIVLRYEHEESKGTISFTVSKISMDPIDDHIFAEPTRGYKTQRYRPSSR